MRRHGAALLWISAFLAGTVVAMFLIAILERADEGWIIEDRPRMIIKESP